MEPKLERRFLDQGELRVKKSGDKRTIFGYATKFIPVQSADLGGFVEEIHPNAFDECLRAAPDVVGLWNHDTNHVLGRTTSGTLRLSTDKTGLLYEIDPPATGLATDLMTLMERGDIHQSSFGFYCIEDSWREGPNGQYIRTVLKAELFDVSPVTFPAYPDATSGVRKQRHVRNLFPEGCDGITCKLNELRAAKEEREKSAPGQKTKMVDGVALHHGNFAYVGDVNDPETWKLPIEFPGDEEKTKSHIRNALSRFNQTEGIPDSEKSKVWDKIVAAAKAHGIEVNEENKSAAPLGVETPAPAQSAQRASSQGDCEDDPDGPGCKEKKSKAGENDDCEDDPDGEGCDGDNDQNAARSADESKPAEKRDDSCMGDDCVEGDDNDEDDDGDCECDCASCSLGDCANCLNERCMDAACRSKSCAMQTRAAAEVETLQLRLRIAQSLALDL